MPPTPTRWRDHLRYRFENTLSRGTVAIIAWLALVSVLIVVAAAMVLGLTGLGRIRPILPANSVSSRAPGRA
jgi:hypothetical protein